jgi:ABC-type dipeptide/oligopeptide/nickel transport system ATPase component
MLQVEGLCTSFATPTGVVKAVDRVSMRIDRGETVALVGESGSGKTVFGLSLLRLIRPPGRIEAGRVWFKGKDLMTLGEPQMRALRGSKIAMVFQEATLAFDPVLSVGTQIVETLVEHTNMGARQASSKAIKLLKMVEIADAERRSSSYPHEFSGGMLQRAMIALAISCQPELLIADEPTTSLDTTTQAQILELLKELSESMGTAVLLVTHNFGVVARYTQRAYVMREGRIVEEGTVHQLYHTPSHPYTRQLWRSAQRFELEREVGQPVPLA